jgi:hypothetical protein
MCPPKPKRMAESSFSPKVCSSRERNHAYNAEDSTSAGTALLHDDPRFKGGRG